MERIEQKRMVVKIGSSTITNSGTQLDYQFINEIARQIAIARREFNYDVALVSSGAIASGRMMLDQLGNDIVDTQVAAIYGQSRLMSAWTNAFAGQDLLVGQALYVDEDLDQARDPLLRALGFGVVVINANDAVDDKELRQVPLARDNDKLATFVAKIINADILALLTDTDGVLDEEGHTLPYVDRIEDIENLIQSKSSVGTGGMWSKACEAKSAAKEGIHTVIANARGEDVILKIVQRRLVGTKFISGFMFY